MIPAHQRHPHEVKCFKTSKRPLNSQFLFLFLFFATVEQGLIKISFKGVAK